jgi:hypothetical protein
MRSSSVVFSGLALLALIACDKKPPLSPTAPPWLPTVVQEQAMQNAPGSQLVGGLYAGVAEKEGQRSDWKVPLEYGKCYWFSAAGDQGVEELGIWLFDPEEDDIEKQKSETNKAMITHCPQVPGLYGVRVQVREGRGHYQMGVYSMAAPGGGPAPTAAPPPTATGAAPTPPQDLGLVCDEEAKSAAAGAARVGNHFAGNADETDWYAQLDADKCYWFIGAGGAGITELWLYLWDPKDKRIAANKSESNKVVVGHCPTVAGMYHFQAKIGSGSGEYKVGVYAKAK